MRNLSLYKPNATWTDRTEHYYLPPWARIRLELITVWIHVLDGWSSEGNYIPTAPGRGCITIYHPGQQAISDIYIACVCPVSCSFPFMFSVMRSCVRPTETTLLCIGRLTRVRECVMQRNRAISNALKYGSGRDQEGLHARKKTTPAHDCAPWMR
jgi:hypothetical protein